jgi:hypothetical protein
MVSTAGGRVGRAVPLSALILTLFAAETLQQTVGESWALLPSQVAQAPPFKSSAARLAYLKRELALARQVPKQELRRLPSRIIVAPGCSGSTFVMSFIQRILAKAAVPGVLLKADAGKYELLHADKNPFFDPAIGWAGAMAIMHARAVRANSTLLFKGRWREPGVASALCSLLCCARAAAASPHAERSLRLVMARSLHACSCDIAAVSVAWSPWVEPVP